MERIVILIFCCVVALGPSACGEDEAGNFEGTYQVTRHTLNDASCDSEGPDVTDGDAFFKLQMGDVFGFPVLEYYSCTSATQCQASSDFVKKFSKLQGDWRIETRVSSEADPECHLAEVIGTIREMEIDTQAGVKIELKTSRTTVVPETGVECHPDLIDTYFDQMVCEEYEVVEARKLEI